MHMAMNTTFEQYIRLLEQFAAREGHTKIPVAHIEDLDGTRVKLGAWVGYIRQRYRRGGLDESRANLLTGLPGWQWGPIPPGPAVKHGRDSEIIELRQTGLSLQQIADRYNISRQRVHQIVVGID